MAIINAGFRPSSYTLNSGALVVKIKLPQTIGAVRLAQVPIIQRNIAQGNISRPAALQLVGGYRSGHYDAYWREKSHLLIGDAQVGWTENPVLPLGNVLTTVVRSFRIYNARENSPIRIVSVVLVDAGGVTLDDPVQPDFVNARTDKVYQLTVSPIGPPVINTQITVTTDAGEVFVLSLTGTRTVVVPFLPQKGAVETVEYKTWIQKHKDGTEQRQGFRDVAIQTLAYEYLNTERISALVENFAYLKADTVQGVAYWMGSTALTNEVLIGALSFDIDNPNDRGFRQGDSESLALIWGDEQNFEAVLVQSIVGNTVTVAQNIQNNWPAGTTFVPLRRTLADPWDQRVALTRIKRLSQSYQVIANLDTPDSSGFTVYESLPVFEALQLARGKQVSRKYETALEIFNPGTAPRLQNTYVRSPQMTWGFSQVFETLAAMLSFRDFFMDRQGRRLAFWIRTDVDDFQLFEDTLAGTDLRVRNVGYAGQFNNNPSNRRKHLAITYADGTTDYRAVLSATDITNDREDIVLNPASSQDLTAANVRRICYLVKVRFASDRLTFTHRRPQNSTLPVSVTDVDE